MVRVIDTVEWPCGTNGPGEERRLLLLTAPGLFDRGWKPDRLAPVGAAVPGHLAVSGWDLARSGPKLTRFAAAAGSVYFLDASSDPPITDGSLCDREDAALGWGTFVEGTWSHV